jgi:hypothetical protein
MKDFKQLAEDVKTNEELSKKLAEAGKELRKTGDKAGFIKTAAEFGYEITEKDFPSGDDLVKVSEEELDDVAGGIFFGCGVPFFKIFNPNENEDRTEQSENSFDNRRKNK